MRWRRRRRRTTTLGSSGTTRRRRGALLHYPRERMWCRGAEERRDGLAALPSALSRRQTNPLRPRT